MKILKHIIILFLAYHLVIGYSMGQSNLSISNGAKMTIHKNTSVSVANTFITGESQVINNGELTVLGTLANWAGTSGLVIKADENGYGTLLHYTDNVNATVEQYLSSEVWHLVSPPISNATISSYLSIYLKEWMEPTSTWEYLVSPVTLPMIPTQGYVCWASDELTGPTTVQFEGNLKSSNLMVLNLSYTPESDQSGWNLIGNPYPSALEWNTNWSLSNVGGWAMVYDNGTYRGWNPWMPDGERSFNDKTDGFISPTQGFWVRATNDNPMVMIPQSARAHKPDIFMKDEPVSMVSNLHLIANGNDFTDEATILFMDEGTEGFDGLYELEKFLNVSERPSIYSIPTSGLPLAVQVLPSEWIEKTLNPVIPLSFKIGIAGECSITSTGMDSFDAGQSVYLEDLIDGNMHNLEAGIYKFYSDENCQTDRFLLHFGFVTSTALESQSEISIYSYGNSAYIKLNDGQSGYAQIFDLTGRELLAFHLNEKLNRKALPQTGYFIVKVIVGDKISTAKIFISN